MGKPLILVLNGREADVVTHALVYYASYCEEKGDELNEIKTAESLTEELVELDRISTLPIARALICSLGLGAARGRPQG